MTIYDYLVQLPPEQRAGQIGCVDGCLMALRKYDPADAAYLSCGTWACPEYLAPALGFAFECKNPGTADRKCCARCAAGFLRMQYPNTGKCKHEASHD